ncbi:MAG: exo-alpha-sialidase [Flavobacteriaceae bacterium TMED42]|nr:MAG: exo-alpha-sialidase [Flavobacteriaceae bacterium TMED42]
MKNKGLLLLVLVSLSFSLPPDREISKALEKDPLFEKQMLFEGGRFPNVVVAKNGTVVTTWGKEKCVSRRSVDGGATWQSEVNIGSGINGGGLTVDENSGQLISFVEKGEHPPAPILSYFSSDQGQSWQAKKIKIHPDNNGNPPSMHMNEHGITLKNGIHKGRLLRTSRYYGKGNEREHWPSHYTNAIYSDNGGKTWHTSNPFPVNGTGEAAIVELSDGSLYYNSRRHLSTDGLNPRMRYIASSSDGGQNWENLYVSKELPDGEQNRDYGLMAGLDRLPFEGHDILIFSNIDSYSGRKNGTVWLSFDGGKSWPLKKVIEEGGFKYSSLAVGRKNTPSEGYIYLLYETGTKNDIHAYGGGIIARFNLSWLMKDKKINEFLK